MKKYLQLMRVKHYIKNFLIFLAIIFSCNIINLKMLGTNLLNFVTFCFISSIIYIFNDICDKDKDQKHYLKKNRPLVKEKISLKKAYILMVILFILASMINFIPIFFNKEYPILASYILLYSYIIINIFYSLKLKNVPILDVLILTFGFILRVIYGALCINVKISSWLYLTVTSVCFYASFGKRKMEYLNNGINARDVLAKYNLEYLNKFMNIFLTSTIIFYSLWAMNIQSFYYLISILIVIIVLMRYSLVMDNNLYEDPVDIILNDKMLLLSIILYIIYMGVILYAI